MSKSSLKIPNRHLTQKISVSALCIVHLTASTSVKYKLGTIADDRDSIQIYLQIPNSWVKPTNYGAVESFSIKFCKTGTMINITKSR